MPAAKGSARTPLGPIIPKMAPDIARRIHLLLDGPNSCSAGLHLLLDACTPCLDWGGRGWTINLVQIRFKNVECYKPNCQTLLA